MTGHLPLEETTTQLHVPLATSHFLQKYNKSILLTTHDCKMHLTQSVQTRKRTIPAKRLPLKEELFQNRVLMCSDQRKPRVSSHSHIRLGSSCPRHTPAHSPTMLRGRPSLAAVTMAEQIVAAPPMSARMRSMFADGLMEMPPLRGKGQGAVSTQRRAPPPRPAHPYAQ